MVHVAWLVVGRDPQALGHRAVVAFDRLEPDHDDRDDDERHPRATGELRRCHDQQHDGRRDRADGVDHDVALVPGLLFLLMVTHHSRLRQRERQEHAHGIQRDQGVGGTAERDDERAGRGREHDHTVREHEAIPTVRELARQIAVVGDDRRQPREVGVRGVGREGEDRGGRELQDHVERRAAAEHCRSQLRHHRRLLGRVRTEVVGQDLHAHEQCPEDDSHPDQGGRGVLRLRAAERGNPVGDRLHSGECDRARREALQQDEDAERATHQVVPRLLEGDRIDPVDVIEHEAAEQAVAHQCAEDRDVDVGGHREDPARLLDAAQVRQADAHDEDQPQRDAVLLQVLERRDRHDGGDTGRDRHCDGEDVVDQQRRTRDERRVLTEVLAADDVAAATARIGEDRLAVRRDDDREQDRDGDADRDERVQPEREARSADRDDEEDLLRRVRGGRDRVRREHRERDGLRNPLVFHLGRRQRSTDEYPFDECHVVGSSEPLGTTGSRQLAIPPGRTPTRKPNCSAPSDGRQRFESAR